MRAPITLPALAAAVTLSGLMASTGALAATTLPLREAMTRARADNPEVAAARARVAAREAGTDEARAYRLPRIALQEIWTRTDAPAEAFALDLNKEVFSFQEFVASDPNDPDPVESALTRFEASLPLYTGGEISARIRQADAALEATELSAERTGDEVALAAGRSWINLAMAREHLILLEVSADTVAAHVEAARAFVDQGLAVSSELLRAEVELARVRDLLATARERERVAAADLAFRLGDLDGGPWELGPLPDPSLPGDGLDHWLEIAGERPDLAAARTMVTVAELEADVARAGIKPRVGLVARYDFWDDLPGGFDAESSAVVAMASVDLFAGGRHRAAVAAAEAEAEATARDVDRFADGITVAVRNAWAEVVSAVDRHGTAFESLDAARENERVVRERFDQGVAETLDVLDATTARREAATRELIARAEANLARLDLAVAAGASPESLLPSDPAGTEQADDAERNR